MYKIKDFFKNIIGIDVSGLPSEGIFCTATDLELTYLTNKMQDSLAAYTYTLVEHGWITLIYNGRQFTLERGDLYIYSPGFQITVVGGSEDYRGMCLMADEGLTLEMPAIRDIILTSSLPVAEWGQPVVHVQHPYFEHLRHRMLEITEYQNLAHRYLHEALRALYALFILDLSDIRSRSTNIHKQSERSAELFISFMRILPKYFTEHHDIGFYADKLFISPTHLSRIVRQITGRTVVDYINQMLLMEASFLLQTSSMSLSAISERLCFADQSSFCKFFKRMKGISPKAFRSQMSK